ncbi:MAG TPA: hypothetical protein GX392_08370 [Clostridiales bacterium]|nr:hypothetical protein [Clostridiales bacterium]
MTLYDALEDIWDRFGYYRDELRTITLVGKEGMEKIKSIMEGLRRHQPHEMAGVEVEEIEDYLESRKVNLTTGEESSIDLPKSNVLKYKLVDDSWFAIRPSGTEPKIKLYFSVKGEDRQLVNKRMEQLIYHVRDIIK